MFNAWGGLKDKTVTVIGDVMLDQSWSGDVNRISPEAPVPVVHVGTQNSQLGGAGNVAANLAELGVMSQLHAVIGEDAAGDSLARLLLDGSIEAKLQRRANIPTTHKLRVLGMSQQLLRLDFEENTAKTGLAMQLDVSAVDLSKTDVLVLSDYIKGALVEPQELIQLAKEKNIPILVDTKSKDLNAYRGVTLLKPNRREFELLVGSCADLQEIENRARDLMQQYEIDNILVTLGKDGMLLVPRAEKTAYFHPRARDVFDVTGAGDTVIATLAAMIAAGASWHDAVELANQAAGIVVEKLGTATITAAELRATQQQSDRVGVVCALDELLVQVQAAKKKGEKVVMTNGCFDVLHAGHVQYLKQAKALGHRLVVAINSDDSVRRLKGETRPINTLADRGEVIASLRSVDWVVSFSEDTPAKLIQQVMPDILVKGGDYTVEQIAGSSDVLMNGGEVKILPLRPGCSSTRIIEAME